MKQICLTNISKTYYENKKISFTLKNLSLIIEGPMLLIIKGTSGSGKSTLLNILTELEKADTGTISFLDVDKNEITPRIGIIFQDYKLFLDQSVYFNISLPLRIISKVGSDERGYIDSLMDKFKIAHLKNKKTSLLSGGEKQRVAITRALVNNPDIIVADEPTGSLDYQNGEQVFDILKSIAKTKLVIVVTHNKEFAKRYADRLIEIKDGAIVNDEIINAGEVLTTGSFSFRLQKKSKSIIWMFSIINKRFIKTKKRLCIITLVTIFCLTFIFMALSFLNNASHRLKALMSNYGNYGVFSISKVEEMKSDNPLFKLTKTMRPEIHEILSFKKYINSLEVYYSLGAIIDEYVSLISDDEVIDGVRFLPIFNAKDLAYDEIYINDVLANKIDSNQNYKIILSEKIYQKKETTDTFNLTIDIQIAKEIEEFKFMNTAVIYYNYHAYLNLLKDLECENYTINYMLYTWYSAITDAKNDEALSYYSLLIKVNSEQVDELINLIDAQKQDIDKVYYQISAFPLNIKKSLNGFLMTLEFILLIFIILSVFGAVLIIALFTYTSFYEFSGESAIILTLGGTKVSISLMFIIYNLVMFCGAILLSSLTSLFFKNYINAWIESLVSLNGLIDFDIWLLINIFIFGSLGILLLSITSIIFGYKNGLMKVLKEQ